MAQPTNFPEKNDVLLCGNNPNCNDLEIWRGKWEVIPPQTVVNSDGSTMQMGSITVPVVISKWKFTPEELEELNRTGGEFYFQCTGTTHPPITLYAHKPNF